MKNNPKVTFILVCWNNEKLLAECLGSITAQTYKNHTTIMVDNGSKDESVARAKAAMPEIEVIETGSNNGFARGNNIGIKKAFEDPDVKYVALINTDAILEKDWLEKVVEFAQNKPHGACFQGTTLDYYQRKIIDSTHIYVNHRGQGVQANWKEFFHIELGPKKVFGVNAAACLISRAFIEAQPFKKLFDESFFMYLEDVDIAARATIMGWDNYLVPAARAYHMGSASSKEKSGLSSYAIYMTYRNNLGMIIKNFPLRIVFKILLAIPRADFEAVRHLIRLGEKNAAKKAVKGRAISILRAPLYIFLRYRLARFRKLDTNYLWWLMNKGS